MPYALIAAILLGAGIILIPVIYASGVVETFRAPKELAFRAEAILLALTGVFAATSPRASWRKAMAALPRREWYLLAAIGIWSVVTTVTSTNRPLSQASLITVAAAMVIYIATRLVAPSLGLPVLFVVFIGALINAVVVTLQELRIWNPFVFPADVTDHLQSVGLLGNSNDVGTVLAGPAVVALVAAVALRGWPRALYGSAGAILFAGIFMSRTRTAMVAFAAGMIVAALLRPRKQALSVGALLIVCALVALRPSTGIGQYFRQLIPAARNRDYPTLFSERLVPFLSAIEMVRGHPVTGVGPGCFKYQFMMIRLSLEQRYPPQWTRGWPMNFGETHNDHLQVAAETGLPGYALFAAAILLLAVPSRRAQRLLETATTERHRVARAVRTPLAATFLVVAIAQFPLQIAAPRLMFLLLAAVSVSWDHDDG